MIDGLLQSPWCTTRSVLNLSNRTSQKKKMKMSKDSNQLAMPMNSANIQAYNVEFRQLFRAVFCHS